MKSSFTKWLSVYVIAAIAVVFIFICAGCVVGIVGQKKTEAQIRHYFGLTPHEPLNDIQAELLRQFPIGTPIITVETSLTGRGLGKDGKSIMWQTNNVLCCEPEDYSDGLLSMHRTEVVIYFDQESKVKQISADSFSYSL